MPDDTTPAVNDEVLALQEQVAKLTEIAARAQADLQNAKQRMERDADDLRRFALQSVLMKLLPVYDHFDRALKQLPADLASHEWVKGVAAIEKDLGQKLGEFGLVKFESLGQPVDPLRHEVLTLGPGAEGVITEVFEDGYELAGKVIRPAKVKVGDGTTAN